MKKALALSAFALVLAFPLVSSAVTISSSFAGSTTGTDVINNGDTIQFEVSISLDNGVVFDTGLFALTGDRANAQGPGSTLGNNYATTAHTVSNWVYNYVPAYPPYVPPNTFVFFSGISAGPATSPVGPGLPVMIGNGFIATPGTGDGSTSLIGTVTITANTVGTFDGGGHFYNGTSFFGAGGSGAGTGPTVTGGAFTVVPEPGTALLMFLGLGGLGVMGRKSRK